MTLEQRVSELERKVDRLMEFLGDDGAALKRMKREIRDLDDKQRRVEREIERVKSGM